jgi:hypothetical protein
MRPEHWLFTIPLRLRSLFRLAQANQELTLRHRYGKPLYALRKEVIP